MGKDNDNGKNINIRVEEYRCRIMTEAKCNGGNNEGNPPGLFGYIERCHSGPLLRHPHLQQATAGGIDEQEGHPPLGATPLTLNLYPATVGITVTCGEELLIFISEYFAKS